VRPWPPIELHLSEEPTGRVAGRHSRAISDILRVLKSGTDGEIDSHKQRSARPVRKVGTRFRTQVFRANLMLNEFDKTAWLTTRYF
jgi:hypothetical protein